MRPDSGGAPHGTSGRSLSPILKTVATVGRRARAATGNCLACLASGRRGQAPWALLDSSSKFPDEADANAADPLLVSIKDSQVRAWLVAPAGGDGLRFDIRVAGRPGDPHPYL